jgi:hypothetical protein
MLVGVEIETKCQNSVCQPCLERAKPSFFSRKQHAYKEVAYLASMEINSRDMEN